MRRALFETGDRLGRIAAALAFLLASGFLMPALAAAPPGSAEGLSSKLADAVVRLHAVVPGDSRTAGTLGTEREGAGVVIDSEGLIVTIGYLVTEASEIRVATHDGRALPATVVGLDSESGLALIRTPLPLGIKPIPLGRAATLGVDQPVLVVGPGGVGNAQPATVVSVRLFAGSWEYLLEDAIFTAPPYRAWSGAALIGTDGRLLGVGSLLVKDAAPRTPGNMFVPIERLKTAMADLLSAGRPSTPPHPWLGVITTEIDGQLIVAQVSKDGPAQRAGVSRGDVITAVAGEKVADLPSFYRRVWAQGQAGVEVPVTIRADGAERTVRIKTMDRYRYLKLDSNTY